MPRNDWKNWGWPKNSLCTWAPSTAAADRTAACSQSERMMRETRTTTLFWTPTLAPSKPQRTVCSNWMRTTSSISMTVASLSSWKATAACWTRTWTMKIWSWKIERSGNRLSVHSFRQQFPAKHDFAGNFFKQAKILKSVVQTKGMVSATDLSTFNVPLALKWKARWLSRPLWGLPKTFIQPRLNHLVSLLQF